MAARRCQFCAAPLEPVQEFRFLVETAAAADAPAYLERIRALPHAAGRPLCVCKTCHAEIRVRPARFARALANQEARSGVIAAGLLSIGWFFVTLVADA